jgi:thiol-disulfide isomerase/thioredoxin
VLKLFRFLLIFLASFLILFACAPTQANNIKTSKSPTAAFATATPDWFDWFSMPLTDVQTSKTFTMNDYAGKVVLLETMAIWCPNCIVQAGQVQKLHQALGNPEDLISVTLDVDSNEDEAMLKKYVDEWGLDWHFAVTLLLVERALGNLYSAESESAALIYADHWRKCDIQVEVYHKTYML